MFHSQNGQDKYLETNIFIPLKIVNSPLHTETLLRNHIDDIGINVDRFYTNYQLKK
jgi:hypothetical protein